jgi:hypothetical protein
LKALIRKLNSSAQDALKVLLGFLVELAKERYSSSDRLIRVNLVFFYFLFFIYLFFLIDLFLVLIAFFSYFLSEVNKMNFNNIAIVFAPTLLIEDKGKYNAIDAMSYTTKSRHFVVFLLENYDAVFK